MKYRFIVWPLGMLAGAALAQDVPPPPASPPAAAAVEAPAAKPQRRLGADMRHCLELKDDKSIIRCAERGRKR